MTDQQELFENYYQIFNWCNINDFGEKLEKPRKVLIYKGDFERVQKYLDYLHSFTTVDYKIEEYNYNEWNYPEDNNAVISQIWINLKKGA